MILDSCGFNSSTAISGLFCSRLKSPYAKENQNLFVRLYWILCTCEGLWFLSSNHKKSRIETCGPSSDGENFTLTMDERLGRAELFQIKFANLLLFSRKLAKYYKGEYPSSPPPPPHVSLCTNCDIKILATLPWVMGIGKKANREQTLGSLLWYPFPMKFTFWNMLLLISASCMKSHP